MVRSKRGIFGGTGVMGSLAVLGGGGTCTGQFETGAGGKQGTRLAEGRVGVGLRTSFRSLMMVVGRWRMLVGGSAGGVTRRLCRRTSFSKISRISLLAQVAGESAGGVGGPASKVAGGSASKVAGGSAGGVGGPASKVAGGSASNGGTAGKVAAAASAASVAINSMIPVR